MALTLCNIKENATTRIDEYGFRVIEGTQINRSPNYADVVPIKHQHYLKEYDFEKNLPSLKEHISKRICLKCLCRDSIA